MCRELGQVKKEVKSDSLQIWRLWLDTTRIIQACSKKAPTVLSDLHVSTYFVYQTWAQFPGITGVNVRMVIASYNQGCNVVGLVNLHLVR